MAYKTQLGTSQQLYIDNQGEQTLFTLVSSSANQQQSQRSAFPTGEWLMPPALFRIGAVFILRVESARGPSFFDIQNNSISALASPPSLKNAEVMPLQQVSESEAAQQNRAAFSPMQPMQPIKPIEPMKMGNMEMGMNPMQMRMGNMEMRMPGQTPKKSPTQFCPQCGESVGQGDRFCRHCGYRLEG